ncbi:hypothetical protein pb186bvf_020189 [Paramecium bursaria]
MKTNKIDCQIKDHQAEIKYICTSQECNMVPIFCQQCLKDHYNFHYDNKIPHPYSVIDEFELSEFWLDPQNPLNQQIKDIQTSLNYILQVVQKIKDPKIESYSSFAQFGNFMKLLEKDIKTYFKEILPMILTQIQLQMIEFEKQMLQAKSFISRDLSFKFRHDQEEYRQDQEISMLEQSQIHLNKLKCIELYDNKIYLGYENGLLVEENRVFHEFQQSILKMQYQSSLFFVQTNKSLFYQSDKSHNFVHIDPYAYKHNIIQEYQILSENQLVISSYNTLLLIKLGEIEGHQINFDNNNQILSINVNNQNSNICVLLTDGTILIYDQYLIIMQQIQKECIARQIQFGLEQNNLIILYDQKLVIFDSLNNVEMFQKKLQERIKLLYQVSQHIFIWFDYDNCIYYYNNSSQNLKCIASLNSGNEKLISYSNGVLAYYEDNNIQKFYPLIYEQ